jgi:hypothetical protein
MAALVASGTLAAPACGQSAMHSSAARAASHAPSPAGGVRRDPFARPTTDDVGVPLEPAAAPVPPTEGLAGLSNDQITVRGVLMADGRRLALVQAPDKKHYVVRAGDRLRDGVVHEVGPGGLVIIPNASGPAGDGASAPPRKPLPFAGENQ